MYGLTVNDINDVFITLMIDQMVYCPFLDSTRDIHSNIPLCLHEFPQALLLGTPLGIGIYLTVYLSTRPNTDTIILVHCCAVYFFILHIIVWQPESLL